MSHCEQPGKPRRRNESIRRNGDINMDIEIYQLIQQVAEMARQAAIDKTAADVVENAALTARAQK